MKKSLFTFIFNDPFAEYRILSQQTGFLLLFCFSFRPLQILVHRVLVGTVSDEKSDVTLSYSPLAVFKFPFITYFKQFIMV